MKYTIEFRLYIKYLEPSNMWIVANVYCWIPLPLVVVSTHNMKWCSFYVFV